VGPHYGQRRNSINTKTRLPLAGDEIGAHLWISDARDPELTYFLQPPAPSSGLGSSMIDVDADVVLLLAGRSGTSHSCCGKNIPLHDVVIGHVADVVCPRKNDDHREIFQDENLLTSPSNCFIRANRVIVHPEIS
jgi:hypothetical protein